MIRALSWLAVVAPPAALVGLGWHRRWVTEDAFIYLRVVHHLLEGHGPVYNPGERVEVYTSTLWFGLLAAGAALGHGVPVEWIAVASGLVLSAGGLLLAGHAAVRFARDRARHGPVVPLGGLMVLGLPPYWDFATSGLETGLVFAWLGGSFWGLVRLHEHRLGAPGPVLARRAAWLSALLGAGPLVRPDLGIFSIGFLGLLLLLAPARRWTDVGRLVATAAAVPVAYQVFRMGYFAALVPNPALAKSAFGAHWEQGWRYLRDLAEPYWLVVPLAVALGWWVRDAGRHARAGRWRAAALLAAPPGLGALHGMYVVSVGGDFMHGRLLLPSLFAILMPVSLVVATRAWPAALTLGTLLPWACASALWLAPPYKGGTGPDGINDERGHYVKRSRSPNPVVFADYNLHRFALEGRRLRALAWHRRVLVLGEDPSALIDPAWQATPAESVRANVVVGRISIGVRGYAAGPQVHVVDRLGLADPIASRLRLPRRGEPGHEKYLVDAWIAARFAAPGDPALASVSPAPTIEAARAALACSPLRELVSAVTETLTARRFVRNVGLAWRLHDLEIAPEPADAAVELCGAARGGAT